MTRRILLLAAAVLIAAVPAIPAAAAAGEQPGLLPFPSNRLTVPDRTSPTGLRVHFAADALPANVAGKHIDPTEWNRQDGFSPGTPILVHVPNLDPAKTGIAPVTDIGRSLAPDAPILLINTRTWERTPYWAELDAHATGQPDRQLLIIRPAVALDEATRYQIGRASCRERV